MIARHLELAGREVGVLSVVALEKLSGDARTNAEVVRRSEIEIAVVDDHDQIVQGLSGAEIIVDCLLGTESAGRRAGYLCRGGFNRQSAPCNHPSGDRRPHRTRL